MDVPQDLKDTVYRQQLFGYVAKEYTLKEQMHAASKRFRKFSDGTLVMDLPNVLVVQLLGSVDFSQMLYRFYQTNKRLYEENLAAVKRFNSLFETTQEILKNPYGDPEAKRRLLSRANRQNNLVQETLQTCVDITHHLDGIVYGVKDTSLFNYFARQNASPQEFLANNIRQKQLGPLSWRVVCTQEQYNQLLEYVGFDIASKERESHDGMRITDPLLGLYQYVYIKELMQDTHAQEYFKRYRESRLAGDWQELSMPSKPVSGKRFGPSPLQDN